LSSISSSSDPSCAVLVAIYNGILYLEDQLTSIKGQHSVNITVFLSDDGSTDDSLKYSINICDYLSLPYIVVPQDYHLFPKGASGNFYRLLTQPNLSHYDYIALADQDDIWHPLHLSRAIYILASGKYAGYSSSVQSFSNTLQSRNIIKKHQSRSQYNYIVESPGPGCSFVLPYPSLQCISKHMLERAYLLSKIKYHDWSVYALCSHFCGSWFIDSFCSVYYRQHSNNVLGDNRSLRAKCRRLSLLFGNFYIGEIQKLILLLDLEKQVLFKSFFKKTFCSRVKFAAFIFGNRSIYSHKFISFISPFFFKF